MASQKTTKGKQQPNNGFKKKCNDCGFEYPTEQILSCVCGADVCPTCWYVHGHDEHSVDNSDDS